MQDPIIPVIVECTKQREKVQRLVQYCRRLDGTELFVLPVNPAHDHIPHPAGAELGIRQAAEEFKGRRFMWIEADAIPIKAGWLQTITDEYYKVGLPYLLPSLEGVDQWDVASAIGIYGPDFHKVLPPIPNRPPWFDLWMLENIPNQIHMTKLIQHRYGFYHGNRVARRPNFPHDKFIIRPEAVMFHADPTQSIIRGGLHQTFYHSGDLGDIIAALPVIKQQGGGHLIIGPCHKHVPGRMPRAGMNEGLFHTIVPLLRQQPYLSSVSWVPRFMGVDKDFSTFRASGWDKEDNLAEWQARHTIGRIALDQSPWITVPSAAPNGRIIIARTLRYHSNIGPFPWELILEKYKEKCLFVGLPQEHLAFVGHFHKHIEFAHTPNLLDAANLIAGADMVFANQTCLWWIAAGLGVKAVQESWQPELNSIVKADNLTYTRTDEEVLDLVQTLLDEKITIPEAGEAQEPPPASPDQT